MGSFPGVNSLEEAHLSYVTYQHETLFKMEYLGHIFCGNNLYPNDSYRNALNDLVDRNFVETR